MEYGNAPLNLGKYDIDFKEMCAYLYLPISLRGSPSIRVPKRLHPFTKLIEAAYRDFDHNSVSHYVYLTVKRLYVTKENPGNRPGWHVDGWGSNGDINYIWSDTNPTEYAIQSFKDIPDDDIQSMVEISQQIDHRKVFNIFDNNTLARLDESVVHRVGPVKNTGMRTFVKISFSKHKYNLEGNSHNHLLDYDWEMHSRNQLRNVDNKDYIK